MTELLGLRGRLAAALVAVSALTLVVDRAARPLPARPAARAGRADLARADDAARPAPRSRRLPAGELRADSPELTRLVHDVRRQTSAEVFVFDALRDAADRQRRRRRRPLPGGQARAAQRRRRDRARARRGPRVRPTAPRRSPVAACSSCGARSRASAASRAWSGARWWPPRSSPWRSRCVAGIVLAARLVRRLAALRSTALQVAEQGPGETPPVEDGRRDEVGDLARAFGTMQRRLAAQEQSRRTFVSTASHELRTPLTSLRADAPQRDRRAHADAAGPARGARPAAPRARPDRAAEQARRGAARPQPPRRRRRAAGGARRAGRARARGRWRSSSGRRRDARRAVAPTGRCWARGDPGAIARIARILLDNALPLTAGRAAASSLRADGDGPAIEVSDCGPGVPPASEERIFERFQRGERRRRGRRLRPRARHRARARRARWAASCASSHAAVARRSARPSRPPRTTCTTTPERRRAVPTRSQHDAQVGPFTPRHDPGRRCSTSPPRSAIRPSSP